MHVARASSSQTRPESPILTLSPAGPALTDNAPEAYAIAERIMRCRLRSKAQATKAGEPRSTHATAR